MKNSGFFKSRVVKGIISGAVALALLLIVFWAGMSFGYKRALFATRFGQNYQRNFLGAGGMMPGIRPTDMMNTHGVAGKIISINGTTIGVQDPNGGEKSVAIGTTTAIEKSASAIRLGDLDLDDFVVVIGTPNPNGQIDAHLIRVIPLPDEPESSSAATSTSPNATK